MEATGVLDPTFTADGTVVTGLAALQRLPSIALTGLTKAIAGWQDSRPTSWPCTGCEQAVYAQEVSLDLLPAPATDLRTVANPNGVILNWTASGEDATTGTAQSIDIHYSLDPINESNFDSNNGLHYHLTSATPLPAGTTQCVEIGDLGGGVRWYFALKTIDQWGHASLMSNVAEVVTKQGGSMTICEGEFVGGGEGIEAARTVPVTVGLGMPTPNPVMRDVHLRYGAPAGERHSAYELSVYDMAGRRIAVIDKGASLEGQGERVWRPREDGRLAPGVYALRFRAGNFVQTRSLVVLGQR